MNEPYEIAIEYEDGVTREDVARVLDTIYAPGERVVVRADGEPVRVSRTVAHRGHDGHPTVGVEIEGTGDRYPLDAVRLPGAGVDAYGILERHGEDLVFRPVQVADGDPSIGAVAVERSPRVPDGLVEMLFSDDAPVAGEVHLVVDDDRVVLDVVKWASVAESEDLERAPVYATPSVPSP